ncbi:MAG: sensor domain-containing diguanylate cyclase [Geminicoccaceae bacterium]
MAERYETVRSLFRRHGAKPPFMLWQPRAIEVTSPALSDLLRWWSALPKIGRVPEAVQSGIVLPPYVADHVILAKPATGATDLRCSRLDGTLVDEAGREPRYGNVSAPGEHETLFTIAAYRAVLHRREAIYIAYRSANELDGHADAVILPLIDPASQACYVLGARILRASFLTMFNSMMDGAIVFDEKGHIRMVNGAMALMLRNDAPQFEGRHVTDIVRAPFLAAGLQTGTGLVCSAREAEARGADGRDFAVQISIGATRIDHGQHYLAVIRDDSAHKAIEEHYRTLALTDPLTGLANRVLFGDRLGQALVRARRARQGLALLMIDLDGFKGVNDQYGHPAGDLALQEFARRLRMVTREADILARLGGDEFALVETDLQQPGGVQALADRLLAALAEPVFLGGQPLTLGASIGIAVFPDDGDSMTVLAEHADRALYDAKARGGCRWVRFGHSDA